ncbi:uncharacterized protein LOC130497507 [Raphanus sativus]|uniref:Uncharacterized protein LOC130497507 n=1 Tax=Raphanus sativus TaxID=3726 RepID=A0A9W3C4C4_RAPSA|nr:uncharacterized protein LOC130497507 [Raphanus sativus]
MASSNFFLSDLKSVRCSPLLRLGFCDPGRQGLAGAVLMELRRGQSPKSSREATSICFSIFPGSPEHCASCCSSPVFHGAVAVASVAASVCCCNRSLHHHVFNL